MLVGLDFDNTIVCYDKAIARLADELFDLPSDLSRTKLALRDFLKQANREAEWTAFQGALYGPGMAYAEPFEQALQTIQALKHMGHSLCIVSHRSLRPYAGPAYDLHAAARAWADEWLANSDLIANGLTHFYETREQKIAAIRDLGCNVFLDDLPEVLEDKHFPSTCWAILFDPVTSHGQTKCQHVGHWGEIPELLRKLK